MVANKMEPKPTDSTKLNKKERNYLIQNCAVCHQEMQLGAGSVTFGGKWYHRDCYDSIQPRVNRI